MRYVLVTVFVCLLTSQVNTVFSQRLIFKSYTINDGLVANGIRRISQDSKGFLWIATLEGLSKYDGHKFTSYSATNGLSHYIINDLYESKDKKLYVAINDGSIDAITENNITKKAVPSTVAVNRFLNFFPGQVIITTDEGGLQEFSNGKLTKPAQPFPWRTYYDIITLNDSLFMVVSDSAIQVFTRKYELFAELKEPNPVFVECKIYRDSQKRIWLGAHTGLKQLLLPVQKNNPVTYTPVPAFFNIPALQQELVTAIFEDDKGIIWMGTTAGLVKVNPDGSHQLITAKDGLVADHITSIFQDTEKNIWFGTSLGLSKLVTKSAIRIYNTENGLLSNEVTFAYSLKKGQLLTGTSKGVQVFDTGIGKFIPVVNGNSNVFYSVVPNNGPLLLFAQNKLIAFDTALLQCRKDNSYSFGNHFFYICVSTKKGNFFLSDAYRLYFFPGKQGEPETILDYRPTCILIDKSGYLWVGTWNNGIYRFRYSVDNDKIKILARDHYLPGEQVRSLFEDSKGNIWIGSRYSGVYLFRNGDPTLPISVFSQRSGLTSNFIKSITEDGAGNIWLALYQGLDKLIKQDSAYRVFNFSRVNNFFPAIVGMITGEDRSLWLATSEGLVQVIDGKMEASHPLPVYITKIISPDSIYPANAAKLNLDYRRNQLQFEFSSPGFINEAQVLYSYRLAGSSNPDWTNPDNQHTVSYANLQAGDYRFEVRTRGWNGEWGDITSFEFVILPPFWQTWWFLGICGVLLLAGGWWLIKRRINYIRHESEMKQKMAETEMMALRAQMNPHFIFNCLNSIDNLIQNGEKEKATSYLAKFARLLRATLENSKNNTIPCWKDLEALKLYLELEEFRCDKKFSYQLTIAPEILQGDYKVPPMIIQPYVENAILHGLLNKDTGSRKLLVEVNVQKNGINYIVEDDGIGRKKAAEYKQINKATYQSIGLDITHERINLFNGRNKGLVTITDLHDENNTATGTRVVVQLLNQD